MPPQRFVRTRSSKPDVKHHEETESSSTMQPRTRTAIRRGGKTALTVFQTLTATAGDDAFTPSDLDNQQPMSNISPFREHDQLFSYLARLSGTARALSSFTAARRVQRATVPANRLRFFLFPVFPACPMIAATALNAGIVVNLRKCRLARTICEPPSS